MKGLPNEWLLGARFGGEEGVGVVTFPRVDAPTGLLRLKGRLVQLLRGPAWMDREGVALLHRSGGLRLRCLLM